MFDFVYRYLRDLPVRVGSTAPGALNLRLRIMLAAVAFSTTTLFIRYVLTHLPIGVVLTL